MQRIIEEEIQGGSQPDYISNPWQRALPPRPSLNPLRDKNLQKAVAWGKLIDSLTSMQVGAKGWETTRCDAIRRAFPPRFDGSLAADVEKPTLEPSDCCPISNAESGVTEYFERAGVGLEISA